jgi:hypothetical protein
MGNDEHGRHGTGKLLGDGSAVDGRRGERQGRRGQSTVSLNLALADTLMDAVAV